MRYVCIGYNGRDYVLVKNDAARRDIIRAWVRQTKRNMDIGWQLLKLNANGTASVLGKDDIPSDDADFQIIEIFDNA